MSVTHNSSLSSMVCLSPDNGRLGIAHIVCEEGSPVYRDKHSEVASRNRSLRNQFKCSLTIVFPFPGGSVHTPHFVKDVAVTPRNGPVHTLLCCTAYDTGGVCLSKT